MSNSRKIKVARTEGEWAYVMKCAGASGDINSFLRREIEKLRKKFKECPKCVTMADGDKEEKVHYLADESYNFLIAVSKIMKKPPATVVDELIINPLLTKGH